MDNDVHYIRRQVGVLSDKDEGYSRTIIQPRDQLRDTVSCINKLFDHIVTIIDNTNRLEMRYIL